MNSKDPKRLERLYAVIKEYHENKVSSWRFCQLIENFKRWAAHQGVPDIFFLDDDAFLRLFNQFAKENKA